ncbi:uncharacterized protein LOC121856798 [Homarus americanus]|uniref:uncharacterized protein LOC121856798 n=1 Tax=Homarus americanus TaxID=6706 RepID=UPI001C4429FA|nr:uncharacterized protein LOC121856798 [Homarus americanus]
MWLAVSLADSGFRSELAGLDGPGQLVSLLGGPGHLGSLLGAGVEAGAVVLAAVLTSHLYRRAFLVLNLLLTAALTLAVICVLQLVKETWVNVDALTTALRFVGVLIVGGARVGVSVVSVEVVPTTARASAVGLCAAHAAVGEILTPLLAIVAELTYPSVPWLAAAAGCLVAALLALLLPETAGTTLPDVVDEAEVVGLCYRGDVLKNCDFGYGRSPYWVEVDGLIVSRSVSEVGLDDDDKFKSLDRNLDTQLAPKASEQGHKVLNKLGQGAGPSQLMVMPHVQTRRREVNTMFSQSSGSLVSSCSHCSLVSLVDVSKVNGNNSDTTDSNYSGGQDETRGLAPGCVKKTLQTKENTDNDMKKTEENRNVNDSSHHGDDSTGKTDVTPGEEKSLSDSKTSFEDNNTTLNESSSKVKALGSGPLESDMSISVCSLQFKHIRRPVSPTDRRRGSGLYYSSSSAYAAGGCRTLIQEYMSRNSFRGDVSGSRYSTLYKKGDVGEEDAANTRITTPSSVLKECIRIARNKERMNVMDQLQEEVTEGTKRCFVKPFEHDEHSLSSQTSTMSTGTIEVNDQSFIQNSSLSEAPSFTTNIFNPSSTLEYEAAGGRSAGGGGTAAGGGPERGGPAEGRLEREGAAGGRPERGGPAGGRPERGGPAGGRPAGGRPERGRPAAGGPARRGREVTTHTLRYDTLRTIYDVGVTKIAAMKFGLRPLRQVSTTGVLGAPQTRRKLTEGNLSTHENTSKVTPRHYTAGTGDKNGTDDKDMKDNINDKDNETEGAFIPDPQFTVTTEVDSETLKGGRSNTPEHRNKQDGNTDATNINKGDDTVFRKSITMTDLDETNL